MIERRLGVALTSLLLGLLLGFTLSAAPWSAPAPPPPAPTPTQVAASPSLVEFQADCPTKAPVVADHQALRARIAALDGELEALAEQAEHAEGAPLEWPTDLQAPWTEAAYTAMIAKVSAADPDTTVLEMDCGEYPCVVRLLTKGDDLDATFQRFRGALFQEGLDDDGMRVSVSVTDEGAEAVWVFADIRAGSPEADRRVSHRLEHGIAAAWDSRKAESSRWHGCVGSGASSSRLLC